MRTQRNRRTYRVTYRVTYRLNVHNRHVTTSVKGIVTNDLGVA